MKKWLAWLQAARITSAINIQLPLAFGHAIAYSVNDMVAVGNLWWLFLYGLGMQLYIVFLNDWSDRFADALNEAPTMFSGGSRVLVQAKLEPKELRNTGLVFGFLVFVWSVALAVFMSRPFLPLLSGVGLGLFWLYSLHPVRMNYRYGGEFLQALGVGGVLPLVAFYFNIGDWIWLKIGGVILGYIFLQLGAAVAFTLPDIEADRKAGKGTMAARFGLKNAVILSYFFSVLGLLVLWFDGITIEWILFPLLPLLLILLKLTKNTTQSNSLFVTIMLISPAITLAIVFIFYVLGS